MSKLKCYNLDCAGAGVPSKENCFKGVQHSRKHTEVKHSQRFMLSMELRECHPRYILLDLWIDFNISTNWSDIMVLPEMVDPRSRSDLANVWAKQGSLQFWLLDSSQQERLENEYIEKPEDMPLQCFSRFCFAMVTIVDLSWCIHPLA